MRDDDDRHGSPPPVLFFERGRGNRDALAADVVQDVDLVREGPAREDLEDFQRRLQGGVGTPVHQLLDRGATKSLQWALLEWRKAYPTRARRGKAPRARVFSAGEAPRRPNRLRDPRGREAIEARHERVRGPGA